MREGEGKQREEREGEGIGERRGRKGRKEEQRRLFSLLKKPKAVFTFRPVLQQFFNLTIFTFPKCPTIIV